MGRHKRTQRWHDLRLPWSVIQAGWPQINLESVRETALPDQGRQAHSWLTIVRVEIQRFLHVRNSLWFRHRQQLYGLQTIPRHRLETARLPRFIAYVVRRSHYLDSECCVQTPHRVLGQRPEMEQAGGPSQEVRYDEPL